MSPKVSVIVPIYNVEAYLSRCLDSLCRQTLREIEIILIDDGSTDGSGRIADRYAQGDHRFRVLHQPNQGLSAARNAGIEGAQAPYLMFVDSDDWVEPDFCRIPYEAATAHGADLVMFGYWRDGFPRGRKYNEEFPEGPSTRKAAMGMMYHMSGVGAWSKLYHRDLFSSIRYPVGRVYEDVATTHLLVHEAQSIWLCSARLYHYCYRRNSIVNTPSPKHIRDRADMFLLEAVDLQRLGYAELAEERLLAMGAWYLVRVGTRAEHADRFLTLFCKEKRTPPRASWRMKIMLWVLRLSPALFDLVCVASGKRIQL